MAIQPCRQHIRHLGSGLRSIAWLTCLTIVVYCFVSYVVRARSNGYMGDAYDEGGIPDGLPLTLDEETRRSSPGQYHNYTHMQQKTQDIHTGDKAVDKRIDNLLRLNFSTAEAEKHRISGYEMDIKDLQKPFFKCNLGFQVNRTECSFANICLHRPNSPQQRWFTMRNMNYNNQKPFQIKRIENTVFELKIDIYPFHDRKTGDVDFDKPIHYIDEDIHLFNTQFGHRWFIYQKALSLHKSLHKLNKETPYHTLYFTHYGDGTEFRDLKYWEDKHVEVFQKFTYDKRPLGTFPGALRDIPQETVCFKTLHFQYDDDMTAKLRGYSNLQKKHETLVLPFKEPWRLKKWYATLDYWNMLTMAKGFQKKMQKFFRVHQIPMKKNRCLLITRREGRNGQASFREIVNEQEVVLLLERYGLEVDMVDFASISSYEQIIRTRQAAVFIGMHGAGMANMLWLHREAKVIELQTYGFIKWGYRNFLYAVGNSLNYHHWVNTHPENALHTDRSHHSEGEFDFYRSRNQIVDIDELEQVVRKALMPAEVLALEHRLLCVKWTLVLTLVCLLVSISVRRRRAYKSNGKS